MFNFCRLKRRNYTHRNSKPTPGLKERMADSSGFKQRVPLLSAQLCRILPWGIEIICVCVCLHGCVHEFMCTCVHDVCVCVCVCVCV